MKQLWILFIQEMKSFKLSELSWNIKLNIKYQTVAGLSLDSARDKRAAYLCFISIHRLGLLAPPSQDARLVPATQFQHIPGHLSHVSKP